MLIFKNFFIEKVGNSGFTLIETMGAVSILLISLASSMSLVSSSLFFLSNMKEQIIATYLSQEAIEYVRNKRDSNSLQGKGWFDGLDKCIEPKKCRIDSLNNTVYDCGINDDCSLYPLRYDPTNYLYGYETAAPWDDSKLTSFIREISIKKITNTEAIVTVNMSWNTGNRVSSFSTREFLFDWE